MENTEPDHEPEVRSYYLLEFLYEETPNAFDMGYLSADPAEIRAALEDQYNGESPTTGPGEQVCLWVVQRGVLAHGLDLNPLIRSRCEDGVVRTLTEIRNLSGKTSPATSYTIDWDTIAAQLPPLQNPLATSDDEDLVLDVPDPFPAPDVPITIGDQEGWLNHGWTDITGG
ncbi:hypothetical protein SAMN05421805_12554 [Saccharopolyspora antimicrobica]|uniref:Uncharacterized protein n=1 Tax=Saccharopolyspora antimicrobica TaxID=455193 RepID=A0A1I5K489_9PSEU|nr:hypothetical protein [Saccharopolyspora antimicrobica]RKT84793.1 hypothetical protein ATL45_3121 [Saccharopolyspora antimicrobica]SFO79892.1 hypothetical protein SAMN05421805_12554 [Saccharopolyspora antimicrobica]